jgi:predicted NAD-dependent protein-ADP-ribosyltransferase YbiA (DUF1768 family)
VKHEFEAKVIVKDGALVVVPIEADLAAAWKASHVNHVFVVQNNKGSGVSFFDLGTQEALHSVPINTTSRAPNPEHRLIGNFAATPFELEGQRYASVESFWQGLKIHDSTARAKVNRMPARGAKKRGDKVGYGATVRWGVEEIPVGTWAHWQLMRQACEAKFAQNRAAREALLATAPRPLVHKMRRDSRTIPGVVMAEIWLEIRRGLLEA